MNITVIIQARVGSSRLPGKVLMMLEDKTVLEHVVDRCRAAHNVTEVIVATTNKEADLPICDLVKNIGVKYFRGSEEDVLDRYYQTALKFQADHIVRVTSDCPVMDPHVIDQIVARYQEQLPDYCSNTIDRTFPDGEDIEVFSFSALKQAWSKAEKPSEREHVTPYIRSHPDQFRLESFKLDRDLNQKRWTLDKEEDFEFLKILYQNLYTEDPLFGMKRILDFLEENPKVEDINSSVVKDEGYVKSMKEDQEYLKRKQATNG